MDGVTGSSESSRSCIWLCKTRKNPYVQWSAHLSAIASKQLSEHAKSDLSRETCETDCLVRVGPIVEIQTKKNLSIQEIKQAILQRPLWTK